VAILAGAPGVERRVFLQTWALAQLLAWTILDQRPGKRGPKKAARDAPSLPKIQTRNAQQAGRITMAYLLDRHLRRAMSGSGTDDQTIKSMLALFFQFGGFATALEGPGAKDLVYDARQANRELKYVYMIVDYMCRYKKHGRDEEKFNIESAKFFIELSEEAGHGISKISKIWEKYKNAAPYIYATRRFLSFRPQGAILPNEVMDWFERFTSDQGRLSRFVGRAAYAADILSANARNVRRHDFTEVERIAPPIRPFSQEEIDIITSIDRHPPVA
jgi:hypothetical protein